MSNHQRVWHATIVSQGANAARNAMEAQLKEAQRALAQNKQDHAKQIAQLQQNLKSEADRSCQLEATAAELKDVTASRQAAQHAADSFSQQLKKLQQQLQKAEQEARQAELTSYNMQIDLESNSAVNTRLEASKAVLQEVLNEKSKKLRESSAEIQNQKKILQEAAVREDASQAKIKQLEIALLAAQGNHAASREVAERHEHNNSADRAILQAEHSELQSRFDSLTVELEAANARLAQQDECCSNLQQAVDAKSSAISTTNASLAAKENETRVLAAAVDRLEAEVQAQRSLQAEQDERFAAASACLSDLKNDFHSLQLTAEADSSDHAASADGQQVKL